MRPKGEGKRPLVCIIGKLPSPNVLDAMRARPMLFSESGKPGIAKPGGIALSEDAFQQVKSRRGVAHQITADEGDAPAFNWSFAGEIGASILALAGELQRRRLTRAEARTF
jgi:hypothetical protein